MSEISIKNPRCCPGGTEIFERTVRPLIEGLEADKAELRGRVTALTAKLQVAESALKIVDWYCLNQATMPNVQADFSLKAVRRALKEIE